MLSQSFPVLASLPHKHTHLVAVRPTDFIVQSRPESLPHSFQRNGVDLFSVAVGRRRRGSSICACGREFGSQSLDDLSPCATVAWGGRERRRVCGVLVLVMAKKASNRVFVVYLQRSCMLVCMVRCTTCTTLLLNGAEKLPFTAWM